jgi:hypothetical protein
MKRSFVALTCLWLTCSVAFGATIHNGERAATIVYADDATGEAVRAWRDLAAYLGKSTGATFEAVAESKLDGDQPATRIYVGACDALPAEDRAALEQIDQDAYIVHVTGDAVFLAGPRPWSTYWAVCQFLEDHVGVRWLIPGPLGEDIPAHESIDVAPMRKVYAPVMRSRLWSGAHYGGEWSLRRRMHQRDRFHHNLLNIFDADKYYDEHPEWFPLRPNGERYRPQGERDNNWQPCMASESSVRHAADAARAAWANDPNLASFSYGCNDGGGWCVCEGCLAMDRPMEPWQGFDGDHTYRYYAWLNKIAANLEKTHPDHLVGCLAYHDYILPPEDIGLHRNIIPYFTSNRADYYEPTFRALDQNLIEWWGRVANQMGIYDYAYGMGFVVPRIYNHLFQEAVQHAVNNGVDGFYAEVYPNWGLDGHKLYIMSAVLWDPSVDIDALALEWNRRMFREAWEPMHAYFARCERAWREQDTGPGHWAYRLAMDPLQFEAFPPNVIAECNAYLDEAESLAQSDIVRQRIAFFRKTWQITELLAGNYWLGRDVQRLVDEQAPLEDIADALRVMASKARTFDPDPFIAERVGDDPIAFFPPKPEWIEPLKSGADAETVRSSASRLAARVVRDVAAEGDVSAAELRDAIGAQIDQAFGGEGSEIYHEYVARLKTMAQKVARVVRSDGSIVIDGKIDEAVWSRADLLTDFVRWGSTAPTQYVTRAWLAHDGDNLYVALECMQDTSDLVTDAAPRDGSAWVDDSVEIFINPTTEQLPYTQFIINARCAIFDLWGRTEDETIADRMGHNFNGDWATAIEPDRWTAELRLPLDEFDCAVQSGSMLRLNMARNVQGDAPEISAWFLSIKAHADTASRGWLIFE